MTLKIDNNLITPSHITEGERVNDTYFDGKYKLMLPNSEHRYLTSDKERKQLLSESQNSRVYLKDTLGHISQNTTTGKMFEEEIVSETYKIVSGFSTSNYLTINNLRSHFLNATSFEIIVPFKYKYKYQYQGLFGTPTGYSAALAINNNNHVCWRTNTGSSSEAFQAMDGTTSMIDDNNYFVKVVFDGSTHKMYLRHENETEYNLEGQFANSNPPTVDAVWNLGLIDTDRVTMNGTVNLTKMTIKINGEYFFNGATAIAGTDYTVVGNPTITEETITTRTVTQKPFEQSITINSSELQEGTKYLVDYPGMFQIKTEDNTLAVKFLFEEEPVWKYIKEEELVEGDNILKLTSDTEKLKFIVNTTEHTLVDSTITEEQKYIVNGTNNNYIQLNVFDHQDLPWEIETFAKYGSAVSSYSRIIDGPPRSFLIGYIDSGSSKNMGFYLSSNGSSWDIYGSSSLGKYLELNKNYYYKLVFDGFSYKYYYKEENASEYTLIVNVNSSTKINKTNICLYGSTENPTTNENTKVNISKTKIKINGEMWFDGATAVEGVDYTVVGSPTIETETVHIGGEIPELTAGYLGYREGWK